MSESIEPYARTARTQVEAGIQHLEWEREPYWKTGLALGGLILLFCAAAIVLLVGMAAQ